MLAVSELRLQVRLWHFVTDLAAVTTNFQIQIFYVLKFGKNKISLNLASR